MTNRKCCNTPKGPIGISDHHPACVNHANNQPTLKGAFDADGVSKSDRIDVLNSIADDLPDGAYFAMAGEMGIDFEDFIDAQ